MIRNYNELTRKVFKFQYDNTLSVFKIHQKKLKFRI